jgi:hypothetical protein
VSYKTRQLSPQSTSRVRIAMKSPWSTPPQNMRDMQFLRSWLELDSTVDDDEFPKSCFNWNAALGMVIAVGISSAFWLGAAEAIARLTR